MAASDHVSADQMGIVSLPDRTFSPNGTYNRPKEDILVTRNGSVLGGIEYQHPMEQLIHPHSSYNQNQPEGTQLEMFMHHPGKLETFFTHPAVQGQGVGRMAVAAALEAHRAQTGSSYTLPEISDELSSDSAKIANSYYGGDHEVNWTDSKGSRDNWAKTLTSDRNWQLQEARESDQYDDEPLVEDRPVPTESPKEMIARATSRVVEEPPRYTGSFGQPQMFKNKNGREKVRKSLL